ncbi:hypothetical protein HPP92_022728 [Vanilla planifolia]|uniref:Uncharacterized protein n=1 Tax=Vanilla planifolia TaxID=51239 RepID=A0A835UFL0_VANPL|nr:hypothetical protein HPP92_022728 [Vanilla planifolia]
MLNSQEIALSTSSAQGLGKKDSIFHMFPSVDAPNNGNFATINKFFELNLEGLPTEVNHRQTGALSREHSPSESPIAEPTLSGGFEVCDGPDQSVHALLNYGNPCKHGSDVATKNESKTQARGFFDSSFNGTGKEDPTKKRRIELTLKEELKRAAKVPCTKTKMAEAKERSSIPSLPSDMQTALKRCESLEKEIRSLKLNLSFMNRKDSEQSKQIEELQKRNEELTEEKEQLLEEKERIISGYEKELKHIWSGCKLMRLCKASK